MTTATGSYVLILRSTVDVQVQIGRWGELRIQPGYYLYTGSAFGPGGLRARVGRHCRRSKSLRWHIDYLRKHVVVEAIWISHSRSRLEHRWAQAFAAMAPMQAIKGFGSSDCRCLAHLFYTPVRPSLSLLTGSSRASVEIRACDAFA